MPSGIKAGEACSMSHNILFWLAIPLGFLGLPVGALGFVLMPFWFIAMITEWGSPRGPLLYLLMVGFVTCLPPVAIACRRFWLILDPEEHNPKHAQLLGQLFVGAVVNIVYLDSNGWIDTDQSAWLLTAYWFISWCQIWSCATFVSTDWWLRIQRKRYLRKQRLDAELLTDSSSK